MRVTWTTLPLMKVNLIGTCWRLELEKWIIAAKEFNHQTEISPFLLFGSVLVIITGNNFDLPLDQHLFQEVALAFYLPHFPYLFLLLPPPLNLLPCVHSYLRSWNHDLAWTKIYETLSFAENGCWKELTVSLQKIKCWIWLRRLSTWHWDKHYQNNYMKQKRMKPAFLHLQLLWGIVGCIEDKETALSTHTMQNTQNLGWNVRQFLSPRTQC